MINSVPLRWKTVYNPNQSRMFWLICVVTCACIFCLIKEPLQIWVKNINIHVLDTITYKSTLKLHLEMWIEQPRLKITMLTLRIQPISLTKFKAALCAMDAPCHKVTTFIRPSRSMRDDDPKVMERNVDFMFLLNPDREWDYSSVQRLERNAFSPMALP